MKAPISQRGNFLVHKILSTDASDTSLSVAISEMPLRELFYRKLMADVNNYLSGLCAAPELIECEAEEYGVELPKQIKSVVGKIMKIGWGIHGQAENISPSQTDRTWTATIQTLIA